MQRKFVTMTITETLYYFCVSNPVCEAMLEKTASLFSLGTTPNSNNVVVTIPPPWKLAGRDYNFVRLAGLSGASAVIFAIVGITSIPKTDQEKSQPKAIYDAANRFHFFHSLALMGVPLTKHPWLTGGLMLGGTFLFSGTIYYRIFTGNKTYTPLAPIGGVCLIIAWLTLLL